MALASESLNAWSRVLYCPVPPLSPCRLTLEARSLGAPLPELQAGALPALEQLLLRLPESLPTPLPASWGASPSTLPALTELQLHMHFETGVPRGWGAGFRQLGILAIVNLRPVAGAAQPVSMPAAVEQLVAPGLHRTRKHPVQWRGKAAAAAALAPSPAAAPAASLPLEWAAPAEAAQLDGAGPGWPPARDLAERQLPPAHRAVSWGGGGLWCPASLPSVVCCLPTHDTSAAVLYS
jgi:hypothetical protein